jgi:sulfur relay (sulfurtransferase) DsrC/TusE family protein
MGHHESNARQDDQKDPVQPDTPGHTIVDMESWQRPIAEQLAELESLDLTPDERALAEGYILEGPEAVEWAEAALAVMPPINDGGYPF